MFTSWIFFVPSLSKVWKVMDRPFRCELFSFLVSFQGCETRRRWTSWRTVAVKIFQLENVRFQFFSLSFFIVSRVTKSATDVGCRRVKAAWQRTNMWPNAWSDVTLDDLPTSNFDQSDSRWLTFSSTLLIRRDWSCNLDWLWVYRRGLCIQHLGLDFLSFHWSIDYLYIQFYGAYSVYISVKQLNRYSIAIGVTCIYTCINIKF